MPPVFGYWNFRGLAEPVRYLLHYTGTEFEDKRYNFGPPPEYDRSEWLNEKFSLDLEFPNLPYYIDGEVKLTQSTAIIRYLAKKNELVVRNEREVLIQDVVEQQAVDLRNTLIFLAFANFEERKEAYLKNLPDQLKLFSKYLDNKEWIIGNKLTYVDFILYDALDFHRLLKEDCLDDFPNLKEYLKRFESLPGVSKYMKSKTYVKWPIFGPLAAFGGK
ncbi:glutathione S-transferase B-like [Centruroides vittatus]|uniref:glutathione S-transferase B-like n=1 Tax=Centruroides vittatus TaxID=120091 RepID=UPI00350F942A